MANKTKQNKTKAQLVQSVVDSIASRARVPGNNTKKRRNRKQGGGGGQTGIAIGGSITTGGPTFVSGAGGNVVVSNQEFISDVTNDSPITGFDVNPGSAVAFPWLSKVAQNFEMYRFRRLEFKYQPACPTTTQGIVVMAFDYDASDAIPVSKQQMSSYAGAMRSNVWASCSMSLKCPNSWSYVGNLNGQINPLETDIKLYDVAKAYFGVFNGLNNNMIGEVFVSYTVELSKPNWEVPITSSGFIGFSGSTLNNLFGTGQTIVGDVPVKVLNVNSIPGSVPTGVLEFPRKGTFLLEVVVGYTSTSIPASWYGSSGMLKLEYSNSPLEPSIDYPDVPAGDVTGNFGGSGVLSHVMFSLYLDTSLGKFVRIMVPAWAALSTLVLYRMRLAYYKKTIEV